MANGYGYIQNHVYTCTCLWHSTVRSSWLQGITGPILDIHNRCTPPCVYWWEGMHLYIPTPDSGWCVFPPLNGTSIQKLLAASIILVSTQWTVDRAILNPLLSNTHSVSPSSTHMFTEFYTERGKETEREGVGEMTVRRMTWIEWYSPFNHTRWEYCYWAHLQQMSYTRRTTYPCTGYTMSSVIIISH